VLARPIHHDEQSPDRMPAGKPRYIRLLLLTGCYAALLCINIIPLPVEVVPTAHYFMGGVIVDPDTRTAIEGLYVVGEDAGGAQGSNRLGGNGVANSTVYGGVAGDRMGLDIRHMGALRDPDQQILDREIERARHPLSWKPGNIHRLRQNLQETMWEDVGVMRTRKRMERGLGRIDEISSELMHTGVDSGNLAFNLTWHDWLNMASLCDILQVIAKSGIAR